MRVYGIFRGFPGLGRVVSGISLMSELKKGGHEVRTFSYLQGRDCLKEYELDFITDDQPEKHQIMPIGINPISDIAASLISNICKDKPDLVIIDGEPLLISTLAMVYPRERIISLLNPTDLFNDTLPSSTIMFLHKHYLSAGTAIVHGICNEMTFDLMDNEGCEILSLNTILRSDVLRLKLREKTRIVAILGGGCCNATEDFFNSTVDMGKKIIEVAFALEAEKFTIYCNDQVVADKLLRISNSTNVTIIYKFVKPEAMYSDAKLVICRAGRNTISELLYLGIPAILMASNGDFRSAEQEKNISRTIDLFPDQFIRYENEDSEQIVQKITNLINCQKKEYSFVPGNQAAMELIKSKLDSSKRIP